MGVLPDVDYRHIEDPYHELLKHQFSILLRDIHTASAESIVDSSREAMTALLSTYLRQNGFDTRKRDLRDLVTLYEEKFNGRSITSAAGFLVGRLHPRRKSVEQQTRRLRTLDDRDAELAVSCVATVIKELGWST